MSQYKHTRLNEWLSTAICGNDILSSALYVSGIAIMFSGILAPLVLLLIVVVLFFYKLVYTEVVEALPTNGGAYNCLLNGTTKSVAAIAGVITILSYVATAVLSAKVGVEYLNTLVSVPIILSTIILLSAFALLVISGIKDSAKVAFGIFLLHVTTLTVFLILGSVYFLQNKQSFFAFNISHTLDIITNQGGLLKTLFLGFSASLLGVSGFESSANFVEEQQKGVFRKTLRNMLLGVAIFNPLISVVILNSMPYEAIVGAKDFLLADAAGVVGGQYFRYFLAVDAFLVLAGAVLTSFVGVSGLIHRMAADACLPNFLTKRNKVGSYPRIVIVFLLLCSSILILTKGNLLLLAGVYTISFLSVMTFFAFGNFVLKETRAELKRPYVASILFVLLAFSATFFGIAGNVQINPNNLLFFSIYFVPAMVLVFLLMYQDYVLKIILRLTTGIKPVYRYFHENYTDLLEGKFVVFVRYPRRLFEILNYISRNETGRKLTLIHCKDPSDPDEKVCKELEEALPYLEKLGVYPQFQIQLLHKNEPFGPEIIDQVSKETRIKKNRMFIGSIHHEHEFDYADLGGVRIIF